MFIKAYITIFALIMLFCGCEGELPPGMGNNGSNDNPSEASFFEDIQPIFSNFCIVCHSDGGRSSFLPLTADVSYGNLVNQESNFSDGTLVVPFDSTASVLYLRVEGNSVGSRMPLDRMPLTDMQIGDIQAWIDGGALNN